MPEGQISEEELKNMSPEEIAELQKKNCVFCKIIKGEVPSHKVYEDDQMIAILDIYPSIKGHTLVLPKQHIQIMPLMPKDVFDHIFKNLKFLAKGVKEGAVTNNATIFIANGGIAGQQSPHFLFHIIPREPGDNLDNFQIPKKDVNQDELLGPLKAKLSATSKARTTQKGSETRPQQQFTQPSGEQLAQILEQNPQLKEIIINNPEQLKQAMNTNPQLKAIFQNINIEELSKQLRATGQKNEPGVVEAEIIKEEETRSSEAASVPKDKLLSKPKDEQKEPEKEKEETKTELKKEEGKKESEETQGKKPAEKKKDDLLDKITDMFT